jgi:hypothetical protein
MRRRRRRIRTYFLPSDGRKVVSSLMQSGNKKWEKAGIIIFYVIFRVKIRHRCLFRSMTSYSNYTHNGYHHHPTSLVTISKKERQMFKENKTFSIGATNRGGDQSTNNTTNIMCERIHDVTISHQLTSVQKPAQTLQLQTCKEN